MIAGGSFGVLPSARVSSADDLAICVVALFSNRDAQSAIVCEVTSKRMRTVQAVPAALASVQIDITTRMGALTAATPTGLSSLDRMLVGGLRTGTLMAVSGAPGIGRTAFCLLLAYMAARARAAVAFTSVALDETEIMARLAARALHREYPESRTPYGAIWSGQAWQDDATRRPVSAAVDTVVKKVGSLLHLHRARPLETTSELGDVAAYLWGRHDRVVLVVDDIEAFAAGSPSESDRYAVANSDLSSRIVQIAYDLRRIAEQGCAVVATTLARNAQLVSPAATLAAELRPREDAGGALTERMLALGARPVDLVVNKNRVGPTGTVPLRFVPGAAVFEERAT
jgi:KaiC/GvpD/RAD55 family RecA-like ATPase